ARRYGPARRGADRRAQGCGRVEYLWIAWGQRGYHHYDQASLVAQSVIASLIALLLQNPAAPAPAAAPPRVIRVWLGSASPLVRGAAVRVYVEAGEAGWAPDALVPAWSGVDAAGSMSDIVQRMLGDGYFNYDLVSYSVAPPVYAQQDLTPQQTTPTYDAYPTCLNCTFIGEQLIIYE